MSDDVTEKKSVTKAVAEMLKPKEFPKDLAVVFVWLILAILTIYIPGVNESFIRVVFTIPVILFIPGYVLIAALFPKKYEKKESSDTAADSCSKASSDTSDAAASSQKKRSGISGIERFALSVGLSIAIVPLIGLALNYTSFGIRLDPILISLTAFTVIMIIVTLFRRAALPKEERFSVPFGKIVPAVKEELFPKDGKQKKLDKALSIILIVAIIAAVVTAVFVIAYPKDGEKFTEFYVLGKDKMADNYPDTFAAGSEQFVWVGIGNHEYSDVTYTVETILLNADWDDDAKTPVIHASKPLDSYQVSVADGATSLEQYYFTVSDTGYNRLEFLLYKDVVPAADADVQTKIDSAYRDLHLWITVA